ncbi:hypothetical protein CLU79DRAFT_749167 [Phycomyces nitens]|nr:hypothetical protein CLU79DRAFT_749167 [Phycomyces nitens]
MTLWHTKHTEFPTQEQLENLRLYKYAAEDKSFVTKYILRPYWDWAITLFPTWIAPNLITLIGLFFMLTNVVFILIWVPDLGTEGPSWIYFSFAAGLWLYSTFDNVDGRQARRTGTSSPLGELFDHGCDALNCVYVVLLQSASLGLGHTGQVGVLLVVTVVGFYLSTVEEYYTGVLYLGYVNGPTEGIIVSCLAFVVSGFYGAGAWQLEVVDTAWFGWLGEFLPEGATFAHLFVWGMFFFFIVTHCPVCLYAIHKACVEKNISSCKTFYNTLYPIISYSLAVYFWLSSPYSSLLQDQHVILFSLYFNVLFGLIASSIILAHLTKSDFPVFTGLLSMPWLMVVLVNGPAIFGTRVLSARYEYILLAILFITSTIYYLFWVSTVIRAFCQFLGIRCLVIRRTKQADSRILNHPGQYNCRLLAFM